MIAKIQEKSNYLLHNSLHNSLHSYPHLTTTAHP
jgi:hypothetical protein